MAQTYGEMDTLEKLYYERKSERERAYRAKKGYIRKKSKHHKRLQMEIDSAFAKEVREAVLC